MPLKRCPNGHFYDDVKNKSCPYCTDAAPADQTAPIGSGARPAGAAPVGGAPNLDPTVPRLDKTPNQADAPEPEADATKPFVEQKTGINPAVGWLVCIDGPDRGSDYRLYAQNNLIGRDKNMAVCLDKDSTISRKPHSAIVSYDAKSNVFMLIPGGSENMVSLNDEAVYSPTPVEPYAHITLGQSTLLFVPLCGAHFQWTDAS